MFFIQCVIVWVMLLSDNPSTSQLRKLYRASANSEQSALQLVEVIAKQNSQLPVWKGYEGVSKMVMAKYTINPLNKLKQFREGKQILEEAIRQDKNSAELRYLRLSVQLNAPSFLGYNTMIETDTKYLKAALKTLEDDDLKERIIDLLKSS